ncbi:MAG: alpha/beta fold hydrolase [Acidobacteria bacterium]|nr:alpha/beta fold hydrolase [Acidobacteriota bacterium]
MRFSFIICLLFPLIQASDNLNSARKGFKTQLTRQVRDEQGFTAPPESVLEIVAYPTELGMMSAYLTVSDDTPKPAIVWVTGGFPPGGMDSGAWEPMPTENDQSAKIFRLNNIIVMYPAFRGDKGNPGHQEGFYGEVQDVLSAISYLKTRKNVDPDRVYLGGHSTGATLALLAAAAQPQIRGVFCFGPVSDPLLYGSEVAFHDTENDRENQLRAPIHFLSTIQTPTYILEGVLGGNLSELQAMQAKSTNPMIHFIPVNGANHFDLLFPVSRLIANKIATSNQNEFVLTQNEVQSAFDRHQDAIRESDDLSTLSALRHNEVDFSVPQDAVFYIWSREADQLKQAASSLESSGFSVGHIESRQDAEGIGFFLITAHRQIRLDNLGMVFGYTKITKQIERRFNATYEGWSVTRK